MKNFILQYWKVGVWCGIIFTISSIPTLPKAGFIWWDFVMKKSAHVIEYAVLYILVHQSLKQPKSVRTIFLFAIAFALSEEFHQSFVIGRTAKLLDVGFDALGLIIAFFVTSKNLKLKNETEN